MLPKSQSLKLSNTELFKKEKKEKKKKRANTQWFFFFYPITLKDLLCKNEYEGHQPQGWVMCYFIFELFKSNLNF